MAKAPLRDNEAASLAALEALQVLDSGAEPGFDALTSAAAAVCETPISLISLIDARRQWFKANVGLPGVGETPRDQAFCAHAVLGDDILEVPDATLDERFADNPLVTGEPGIRFYAGAPIRLSGGHKVGTLCVIDRQPRRLSTAQRDVLRQLAVAVAHGLEGRVALRREHETAQANARAAFALHHSADAIVGVTAQGLIERWNPAAEQLFGYAAADILGRPRELIVPESWRGFEQDLLDRLHEGQTRSYKSERQDIAGRVLEVEVSLVPEFDGHGALLGATSFLRDTTARNRAELALRQSQEFLARTGALAGVGGWQVELPSGRLLWSDEVFRIHGMEPGVPPSVEQAIAFYEPGSVPIIQAAVDEAIAAGTGYDLELQIRRCDGQLRWVRSVCAVEMVDGRPVRLTGAFQDITERRRLATELVKQHELLKVTLDSIGDAVVTTDADGTVTWLNPVAERMTGWRTEEASGCPLARVFHIVNARTRLPAEIAAAQRTQRERVAGPAIDTVLISRDGREFGIEDSTAPILNEQGELLGMVLVFHDVTEQRRLSNEMSFRACHDAMTGLVNRAEFEARLQEFIDRAHEDGGRHALIYIDLDQFKLVNDACGHAAGDRLLQQVAKLLQDTVRSRDILARLGGDEFGIILDYCPGEQAGRLARQICEKMEDFRFIHGDQRFRVSASIGLVPVDERWDSTAAVLQAADISCYAAKEAGRNRVHAWFDTDAAMRVRSREMQWAHRLEQALDENRFVLFAQRIFPIASPSGKIIAEVLLRLVEPDGTLTLPGAFLPAAERFNLSARIDRWVLRRAIAVLADMGCLAHVEVLHVNLSGQSIGDRVFHLQAVDMLQQAGAEVCRRICLEITETAAITNMADATVFIEQVHDLGCRVALDDFGAGASSFGYLKALSADMLKIDGQFVKDIVTDPLDEAAVRCFVQVAKVVGMATVAEFVDHPAVLDQLREIGVDYAQGFLLHRPEPIEAVFQPPLVDPLPLRRPALGG
ncbi:MAG: EAL domain-containing protein [Xanthomonadaceae bacterium]|nr:EAL domain-containing protein [Xanthomonadaceae bacterium]